MSGLMNKHIVKHIVNASQDTLPRVVHHHFTGPCQYIGKALKALGWLANIGVHFEFLVLGLIHKHIVNIFS